MNRTATCRVGALLRRQFRRKLMSDGVRFREDRGLLDSLFVIECSDAEYEMVAAWFDRVASEVGA